MIFLRYAFQSSCMAIKDELVLKVQISPVCERHILYALLSDTGNEDALCDFHFFTVNLVQQLIQICNAQTIVPGLTWVLDVFISLVLFVDWFQ